MSAPGSKCPSQYPTQKRKCTVLYYPDLHYTSKKKNIIRGRLHRPEDTIVDTRVRCAGIPMNDVFVGILATAYLKGTGNVTCERSEWEQVLRNHPAPLSSKIENFGEFGTLHHPTDTMDTICRCKAQHDYQIYPVVRYSETWNLAGKFLDITGATWCKKAEWERVRQDPDTDDESDDDAVATATATATSTIPIILTIVNLVNPASSSITTQESRVTKTPGAFPTSESGSDSDSDTDTDSDE